MPRRLVGWSLLVVLSFVLAPALRAQDLNAQLKEIDDYAAKAGVDWRVPGFARLFALRAIGNRQLQIDNRKTHPLPQSGTDLMTSERERG